MKTDFKNTEGLVDFIKSSTGKEFNKESAEQYAAYCMRLLIEKNRDGKIKNPWMQKKTVEQLDGLYRRVSKEGLDFDGKHVTLQARGITYDHQAYKNKMLIVYPESIIDLQLAYEGDTTDFSKESGKVVYSHHFNSPFNRKESEIIGGYCVIKNRRGEFLTILTDAEILKHKEIAKTKDIWNKWKSEMYLKTIMRKSTKIHFEDEFQEMNEVDNENYDLELSGKSKIDILNIKIVELLDVYQGEDKGEIQKMCLAKKEAKEFNETFAQSVIEMLGGE